VRTQVGDHPEALLSVVEANVHIFNPVNCATALHRSAAPRVQVV
jgi:hypothetical protein